MTDQASAAAQVCQMLDAFQREYRANAFDDMPGNEHYAGKLMVIVAAARDALLAVDPGLGAPPQVPNDANLEITACGLTRRDLHAAVATVDREMRQEDCPHVQKGATPRGVMCRTCRKEWIGEKGEAVWKEMRDADQDAALPSRVVPPDSGTVADVRTALGESLSNELAEAVLETRVVPPEPPPTHLPRRPLVTDVTPSAVEWTFTEYGGSQGKAVVVLTKEQALHIKEYLTATSERGQPPVDPIAEIFGPEARCLCGHKRSRHGVVKAAVCYECTCERFVVNLMDALRKALEPK